MKRYQVQVDCTTITYGFRTYEINANSKKEAEQLYHQGSSELVDEFDNKSSVTETNPEIISESELPKSLLDYE